MGRHVAYHVTRHVRNLKCSSDVFEEDFELCCLEINNAESKNTSITRVSTVPDLQRYYGTLTGTSPCLPNLHFGPQDLEGGIMDLYDNTDFFSLAEEKFDFDVSLSPASSKEDDEDEVFVGPVCHKERCISVGVDTLATDCVGGELSVDKGPSWSNLAGDKFEQMCKEAQQLASQLGGNQQQQQAEKEDTSGTPTEIQNTLEEEFVQVTGDKLEMFRKPPDVVVLSPIKRATFCVEDSPMKQLPPAIQRQMLKGGGRAGLGVVPNTAKALLSTSSPARTQAKMALRSRAGLATSRVLPSKPAARLSSTTSSLSTAKARTASENTRLPPPSKGPVGMRRSFLPSRASSCDDLSDTSSMASDVSDCSLNSSLLGRRTLAPPTTTGLRSLSAARVLPPQTRRVTDRRNTTSSSSSVSSFNSSLSVSPTRKGNVTASLNSTANGPAARAPTSVSRLANPGANAAVKTRRSSVYGKASEPPPPTAPTTAGTRRSISVQARRPSEAKPTPVRRAPSVASNAPTPATPATRPVARTSSVPNVSSSASATRTQIGVKANAKPKALVAPTPTSQLRGLKQSSAVSSPDAPRIMKPKRLLSACNIDSLPQKPTIPAPEFQTPQAKKRRTSALPTPVNRRVSGIPTMTPMSLSRLARPSPGVSRLPPSTRKASSWSPTQVERATASEEEQVCSSEGQVQLQPFSLENEEQPLPEATPPETQETSPTEVIQENQELGRGVLERPETGGEVLEHPETDMETDGEVLEHPETDMETGGEVLEGPETKKENLHPETGGDLMQLQSTEDTKPQTQEVNEVLLVDAPVPVLRHQEKFLIDLSNTPELARTGSIKPSGGQLIDLTSPLIKWSPENKKENALNDAPLINLSF